MNAIVRLPHPQSGDSQGQETFLAHSADTQTRNYDTRVRKPPSLPIYIYIYIYIYATSFQSMNLIKNFLNLNIRKNFEIYMCTGWLY